VSRKSQRKVDANRRSTSSQQLRRSGRLTELTGVDGPSADPEESRISSAAARAKRAERLKRNMARARARRTRAMFVLAGVAVLVVALTVLYRSNLFSIQTVDVTGVKHLTAAQVRTTAAIPENATLLRLPKSAIEARLDSNSWIFSVRLQRVFPDTLRIVVTERTAVALISGTDAMWTIDGTGMVLAKQSLEETVSLTVIRDVPKVSPSVGKRISSKALSNALAVVSGIGSELRGKTDAVSAPAVGETTLLTDGGVEVLIGEATQLQTKDTIIRRILKEQAGKVVFIDVRSVDRPVWRGLGN